MKTIYEMSKNFDFLSYASSSTTSIVFLMILLSSEVKGEQFQYYLDVVDKMKSEWSYADFSVGTKIQCASLCHRQREQCSYFGYKEGICNLMTDSLDESQCSEDECSDPGMKIYKLKVNTPATSTTTQPSTKVTEDTTSTTIKTSTTETTTITEEPSTSTSTTLSPTTQKVSTSEKPDTTSTTADTTTELPLQTTTSTIADTTTELPLQTTTSTTTTEISETTTTTVPSDTTTTQETETTTTTEPTTTTTTTTTSWTSPETTTSVDTTSTTTLGTSTTEKPFSCDPPNGAEAGFECPTSNLLLNALGSKSPFFGDALSPKCYDFKEKMYDDSVEEIYYFFSPDGGFSISAQCPEDNYLIIKYKLCVMNKYRPSALTIHCSPILDPKRIDDVFNATSKEWEDALVNCNDKAALQKIFMVKSDKDPVTRVIHQCVLFDVPDNEVAEAVGDNPVG